MGVGPRQQTVQKEHSKEFDVTGTETGTKRI